VLATISKSFHPCRHTSNRYHEASDNLFLNREEFTAFIFFEVGVGRGAGAGLRQRTLADGGGEEGGAGIFFRQIFSNTSAALQEARRSRALSFFKKIQKCKRSGRHTIRSSHDDYRNGFS